MLIIKIKGVFYIITPSNMFRLSLFEPSSGWSIIYLRGNTNNWQFVVKK